MKLASVREATALIETVTKMEVKKINKKKK